MMNFEDKSNPLESYRNLQKQLDDEHKRLLKQREEMLSRQNERLQLYQKLDLVEFFNYSTSKEESKQKMMYYLSQKFKDYMRKLTQNNVYKMQGQLINNKNYCQMNDMRNTGIFTSKGRNQQRKSNQNDIERSVSSKSRRSNVQRNSDLGRMFQTMRYYQQKYQSQNNPISKFQQRTKTPRQSVDKYKQINGSYIQTYKNNRPVSATQKYPNQFNNYLNENNVTRTKLDKARQQTNLNYYSPQRILKNQQIIDPYYHTNTFSQKKNQVKSMINKNLFPQTQIGLQIEQLRSALAQQQKIYLLTELNHYIKLFKQSQIKRNFQQKHLQNLHQFILQIKQKNYRSQNYQRSISKSRPKYDRYTNSQKQNNRSKEKEKYLQQENKMLKKQLQIYVNQLNAINKFSKQDFSSSQTNTKIKCNQVKKVDRFKQFAQHIHIMQNQLNILTIKVNNQNSKPISQMLNNQNQTLITELKNKILMLQNTIERQEIKKQQFFQEVKKFKQVMNIRNQEINTLKSQLKIKQSLIDQLKKQKQQNQISQFINRTLKSPQEQVFDKRQFRYSQVTTNSPSQFQYTNSRVQSNSNNYDKKILNQKFQSKQNTNPYQIYSKIQPNDLNFVDSNRRTNYHATNYTQSKQSRNSRSNSKYSLRSDSKNSYRSKSKTDYTDSYEPKPYERYNKLSDYSTHKKSIQKHNSQSNPLYQRITYNN